MSVTFVLRNHLRTGNDPTGTLTFFEADENGVLGDQLGTAPLAQVPGRPGVLSATIPDVELAALHDVAATYSGNAHWAPITADDPVYGNAEVVTPTAGAQQDLQRLYFDVLGRTPDAEGLAYWLPILRADGYGHAAWAFAMSDEHLLHLVDDTYLSVLQRPADEGGARYYLDQLRRGKTLEALRVELAVSAEAREVSHFGFDDNADFVDWLYFSLLERFATTARSTTGP